MGIPVVVDTLFKVFFLNGAMSLVNSSALGRFHSLDLNQSIFGLGRFVIGA